MGRLMPLLLEWLAPAAAGGGGGDVATRLAALNALQLLVRHTWPRAGSYAPDLRHHLHELLEQEEGAGPLKQGEQGVEGEGREAVCTSLKAVCADLVACMEAAGGVGLS